MTITVNRDEFVDAVRRLAADDPEHVYQQTGSNHPNFLFAFEVTGGCLYSDLGVEPCILGRAFVSAGVDIEDLRDADSEAWGGISSIIDSGKIVIEGCTDYDRDWLIIVQDGQDSGSTWAAAVAAADEVIADRVTA